MISPKVQAFCQKFSEELERGGWGMMEPDIFRNLALGLDGSQLEGLWANQASQDEMQADVEAMHAILEKVLS